MKQQHTILIIDGHQIPVIVDPDAKWIEIKDRQRCPDCEAARRKFTNFMRDELRAAGLKAYKDGLADSLNHLPEDK